MKSYPEIIIQRQPNRYTCYPTCVSILTGIPLKTLLEIIGHDGSERDGFRYDEVALALLTLGWSLTCLSDYDFDSLVDSLSSENIRYRMILSIERYKHYHAVAWDGNSNFVIDPIVKNQIVPLKKIKDKIISTEILAPVEERKMTFLDTTEFKSI